MKSIFGMGFDMPPPPKRRREPLAATHIFQLRIDIAGARPPIWRRIEMRSDINLYTLHRVIQGAFGWLDAHLYRFSIGHPFAWDSEQFLCDFDFFDGEDEGASVEDVRIDETLQAPGDQLDYLYDYGDNWHLTIKLEKVRSALPDDPIAVCTTGRRAAPPEDSGGVVDPDYLAEFLGDPAFFDLAATNEHIGSWLETPAGFAPAGPVPQLSEAEQEEQALLRQFPQFRHILDHCYREEARAEIFGRLRQLAEPPEPDVTEDTTRFESLGAVQGLLDEVGTGVKLTAAGYLPPKIAYRVGEELGLWGVFLSSGGESKMIQVIYFREALQNAGLLRKRKGDLLPTKAGQHAREEPPLLWNHLVQRLLPREPSTRDFSHDAALLTLLFAATSDSDFGLDVVADLMTESGWRVDDDLVQDHHVVFGGSWQTVLLWYIAPKDQRFWFNDTVSPAASELARGALLGMQSAA